jgi:ATP-dependent DNA helicase RecQ
MPFSPQQALSLLRQHFGHEAFRNGQDEVIRSVMEGRDALVVMPTGGGKSLCYQLPAVMLDGVALVISPLIALMQDQVAALARARIRACFINSTLPMPEIRQRLHDARFGKYKLIYVAPERLESKQFLDALNLIHLSFIAVDEAHCISEWGHDFRPAYLNIVAASTLIAAGQGVERLPTIALTATATPEVQTDIAKQLALRSPDRFARGFDRPNLVYSVEHTNEKTARVGDFCSEAASQQGSSIVYCGSRKRVEEFTEALRGMRIQAESYHGGMNDKLRSAVLERFLAGQTPTIVATNAFGMGVDKPNVRNVIHCDLTLTLEAYYQEAGRAGRDGQAARCTVLYSPKDRKLMEFFLNATYPDLPVLEKLNDVLYDHHATPRGAKSLAAVLLDEAQLANRAGMSIPAVQAALALFERYGVLRRGSTQGAARVQFLATRERLREYHDNISHERRTVLNALYRLVGAQAYDEAVSFNVDDLWRKYQVPSSQFQEAVRAFEFARLVRYEPPGAAGGITLLLERMPVRQLPIDWQGLIERRERAFKKLDIVQRYAETPECKRNFLLHYFGEEDMAGDCGKCSSCTAEQTRSTRPLTPRMAFLRQHILAAAVELDGRFGKTVLSEVVKGNKSAEKVQKFRLDAAASFGAASEFAKPEIMEALHAAINEGLLYVSADQYPTVHIAPRGLEALTSTPEVLRLQSYNRDECLHPELLKICVELRRELAARERVAENAVIDDRSLTTLVNTLPRNLRDVHRAVPQMGKIFHSRFAAVFVRAVQEYCSRESAITGADTHHLPPSVQKSVELAREGHSVEGIAEQRGLTSGTIAQHLQSAIEHGVMFSRVHFVDDELYAPVRELLRMRPHAALKDVRAALELECEWPEIRLAVAFARQELIAEKELMMLHKR